MDIVVAILVALMAAGISYATLNKSICSKIRVLRPVMSEDHYESRDLRKANIVIMVLLIAISGFIAAYRIMQLVSNLLGICKMFVALLCMIGAACVDFREKRIPNFFPLTMALAAVVMLALEVILQQDGAIAYVTSSVAATVACALLLVLASILTKDGIGAGDIKLICALSLLGGIYVIMGTLFFGVIACSVAAIVLLLSKKKTLKGSVPFGPFLLLGFFASIILSIF